jgi:hypothetical protein
VAPGSDHKGAIGRSVMTGERSGRFGADQAVLAIEGSDSKCEGVLRKKMSSLEPPFCRRLGLSDSEAG